MSVIPTPVAPTPAPASNTFKALVRTFAPFIESGIAGLVAALGFHATATTVAGIVGIAGTVLTIVLHAAESKWPAVGALLGWIGAPVYAPSTKITLTSQVQTLEAQLAAVLAAQYEAQKPSAPSSSPVVAPVSTVVTGGGATTVPPPNGILP